MKGEVIDNGQGFRLLSNSKVLIQEDSNHHFIYVGEGEENIQMYAGNFDIDDYVESRIPLEIENIEQDGNQFVLHYTNLVTLVVNVEEDSADFEIRSIDPRYNRFWIRLNAEADERVYGCGEQFSYFNLRGRNYPLWTREPGNGRSKDSLIKFYSDRDSGSGGEYHMTYFPQKSYISSNRYMLYSDSNEYSDFDFSHKAFHELYFWKNPGHITLKEGERYEDLIKSLADILGYQEELPLWIEDGAIIGLQGGTERVRELLNRTKENGIKVNAVFVQDWSGNIETGFGYRVFWDWKWSDKLYPGLPEFIEEIKKDGVNFMGYINPYLNSEGDLFREADSKGYLMKDASGKSYLIDCGDFYMGTVDLTNQEAFDWYKEIIKKNMIALGMTGWMADFGEYIPSDAVFYSGEDAKSVHNQFPVLWARCNYEAVKETGNLGKIVYFMRSGGAKSQMYSTLAWNGDQGVDFTKHDGLPSAINATLSLAMSAYGIAHSDIGGYTSIYDNIRTADLFKRWVEMAAFTPVMRTHEGNRPKKNFQYYDDKVTMEVFSRMTEIHRMLIPYIRELVEKNHREALPVQRPLLFYYESDEKARDISTEYLLGRDLLVCPVLEADVLETEIYLPDDEWIDIWTGEEVEPGKRVVKAEYGFIPVFYRKNGEHKDLFRDITKGFGRK